MWDWAASVRATTCQCSDTKPNLPCTLSAPVRKLICLILTAGLKSVSTPVSRLLRCLGDRQCHWDDGLQQPGFMACRKYNTAMPVLLPEMRQEVGWLCPHGAKLKPISSYRAGWDMRVSPPETEQRDPGCLQCGSIGS